MSIIELITFYALYIMRITTISLITFFVIELCKSHHSNVHHDNIIIELNKLKISYHTLKVKHYDLKGKYMNFVFYTKEIDTINGNLISKLKDDINCMRMNEIFSNNDINHHL